MAKKEEAVYHKPDEEPLEEEEETTEEEDLEDDEVKPWEEGFEQGAKEEGQLGKDALTGQALIESDEVVELEWQGRLYRFANQKNADLFLKKKKEELKPSKKKIHVKERVSVVKKASPKKKILKNKPSKTKAKKKK